MSKFGLYLGNYSFEDDAFYAKVSYENVDNFYFLNANLFDKIVVDRCFQKLKGFNVFLENVKRILKPNGEVILILPDYKLYEKFIWPSTMDKNNVNSFSIDISRKTVGRESHWQIENDLIELLENYEFFDFEIYLDDNSYDYEKPILVDQTKDDSSCCIILKCKNKV